MRKHYVRFHSPGTLCSEESEKQIHDWDVEAAVEMARTIRERNSARPYGFRFITREDISVVATSPMYYLGGRVETLDEIEARNDPSESILRQNMKINGWDSVVFNDNSWRHVSPLEKDDVVLPVSL